MAINRSRLGLAWSHAWLSLVLVLAAMAPVLARAADRPDLKIEEIYDAPSIEKLAASKVLTLRVAFLDDYGRDISLVSFLRSPAEEPRVEVRFPRSSGVERPRELLTAPISAVTWNVLVADAANFDRTLVEKTQAPRPDGSREIVICLHGWTVMVEAVDEEGHIRRRQEGACDHGLTAPYGFALAKAAVAAMPACAALRADRVRNAPGQLVQCGRLAGDRAAAAELLNTWNDPMFAGANSSDHASSIANFFHPDAVVTWPGEAPARGMVKASEAWIAHLDKMDFYPERIFGETPDRVSMEGVVGVHQAEGDDKLFPAMMVWSRTDGYGFRMLSLVAK